MEKERRELAEYILNLQMADIMKKSKGKEYIKVKNEIISLKEDKKQVNLGNEEIINRVITKDIKKVRNII